MRLVIREHSKECLIELAADNSNNKEFESYLSIKPRALNGRRNEDIPCYYIHCSNNKIELEANYYIGLDWIGANKKYVHVTPKVNLQVIREFKGGVASEDAENSSNSIGPLFQDSDYLELNYLNMLQQIAECAETLPFTDGVLFIDWNSPEIEIEHKDDLLTPFLIVQFLNLLKQIVRKGLRKSYYKIQSNLQNKVKGKILVGATIKANLLKNRITHTFCEYQEFGIDNVENRFLKKVLNFVANYIPNNPGLFKGLEQTLFQIISYCSSAFENVSEVMDEQELKQVKGNVFFKEYISAIRIGQYILKRFAYNISNISKEKISTPPFWIDMPRLFELYVYRQLLNKFSSHHVKYHFSTYGNELDFLITAPGCEMVVDAKYKLHYQKGQIHQDIRQVAGYARLSKVYKELGFEDDKLIDCLIIYPDIHNGNCQIIDLNDLRKEEYKIHSYRNIYKIGIKLPLLTDIS